MNRADCQLAIDKFERKRQIGELFVEFPEPPKWNEIYGHDLPKEQQKFRYSEKPPRGQDPTEEFIQQEMSRFANGYWFYNNGNLEYISNIHYFFLNYWKDKKGRLMRFIDSQREFFLLWMAVEVNKNLAGLIIIANRRFGKTQIATCILYFRAATNFGHWSAIQSKTGPDAKGVFNKLISSWTKLPDWIKPLDSGETRPATALEFAEPRKRSSKKEIKVYDEVLDSRVDYRNSGEGAYDGEELDSYVLDEAGKNLEAHVNETWTTVKKCLMRANTIRGKGVVTTTVEEMEKKGGKWFKLLWDEATLAKVNPVTGRNNSLATRVFFGADWGYEGEHPVTGEKFVDEYGYSNREAARKYILDTWSTLEGEDLASEQRKDALEVRHAFQLKNFGGCFDNEVLQNQLDYLEGNNDRPEDNAPPNLLRRITFYRELQKSTDPNAEPVYIVKWRDDPKGACEMVWDFDFPSQSNKYKPTFGGLKAPGNEESFAIGVDPIGATLTTGTEKSQAVAYVYRKGDINDPENSAMMILRYAPPRKTIRFKRDFHRYVMMLCEYYGCKANYENNIDDYYETFIDEGFKNYVMWRPKATIDPMRKKKLTDKYGTPSNDPFALQKQTDIADEYIKVRWHKIYFVVLVKQLLAFDQSDRTHSDECIAFFMALIGGTERKQSNQPKLSGMSILPIRRTG